MIARRQLQKLFGVLAGLLTTFVASTAFAEAVEGASAFNERDKWIAVAAGFGIALAAFGGALGQGRTASAALESIGRNPSAAPQIFTPMILGLALIESLVIYALIIAIMLFGKIH